LTIEEADTQDDYFATEITLLDGFIQISAIVAMLPASEILAVDAGSVDPIRHLHQE
jgi:hypothetical protein